MSEMVERVRAALESYRLDPVSAGEARVAIEAMRLDPSLQSVSCSTDFVDAMRNAWMEWEIVPHDFKRANAAAVDSWNAGIDAALGKGGE